MDYQQHRSKITSKIYSALRDEWVRQIEECEMLYDNEPIPANDPATMRPDYIDCAEAVYASEELYKAIRGMIKHHEKMGFDTVRKEYLEDADDEPQATDRAAYRDEKNRLVNSTN